jgi:hypothetical protein
MFKLICDLEKASLFANETSVEILRYSGCEPCGTVNYKLTSSSNDNLLFVIFDIAAKWSRNALSPHNPAYKDTYNKLLPQEDLSLYKYIGLFEDNNRLPDVLRVNSDHNVAPIYESIQNNDEEIWHKSNYLNFPISVKLQPGIFKQVMTESLGKQYVIDSYFLNYTKGSSWHECISIENHEALSNNYTDYINSVKDEVKTKLIEVLDSEIKICNIDGVNVAMVGVANAQQDIESMCHELGGRFPSIYEIVKKLCDKEVKSDLSLVGNEAFNVTCGNYHETLPEIGFELAGVAHEEL